MAGSGAGVAGWVRVRVLRVGRVGRVGRRQLAGLAVVVVVVAAVVGLAANGGGGGSANTSAGAPFGALQSTNGGVTTVTTARGLSGGTAGSSGLTGASAGGSVAAGSGASASGAAGSVVAGPGQPIAPSTVVGTLTAPRVVQTGSIGLTLTHGSLQRVVDQVTNLVSSDNGLVSHSDVSTNGGVPSANLTLRVPNQDFAATVTEVERMGRVTSSQTSGDDVTSQYVDLQSRIQALQASRQQYLTIMARASTIGDVLAVQSQLDGIQSQLEQLQGQMNVLSDQTTFATLDLSLVEAAVPGPVRPRPTPSTGLAHAWHRAAAGFTAGVDWLVAAAGPLAFALLLVLGLAGVGRGAWALVSRAARRHRPVGLAAPTP